MVVADARVEEVLELHLAARGHADIGRGATDVEADHALEPGRGADPDAAEEAADRAGHEKRDRPRHGALERGAAAARLHEVQARREAVLAQLRFEALEVARGLGSDEGVEARGREPLVFAVLRYHLVARAHEQPRRLGGHDFLGAALMRGIEERHHEADRNGLDALGDKRACGAADGLFVEWRQDRAVRPGDALAYRQAMIAADERIFLPGQLELEREIVRALVARDVEDVAKALGGDEPGLGAVVLEHDVGRDRSAVHEIANVSERGAGLGTELGEGRQGACRRIAGRGRDFVDLDGAARVVHEHEIGVGAADVDSDALHGGLRTGCPSRRRPRRP